MINFLPQVIRFIFSLDTDLNIPSSFFTAVLFLFFFGFDCISLAKSRFIKDAFVIARLFLTVQIHQFFNGSNGLSSVRFYLEMKKCTQ